MSRLSIAFVVALFFHLLLSVLPWSREQKTLPEPMGNKAITINLTETKTRAPASPQREQLLPKKLVERPVPETKNTVAHIAKPLESIEKTRKLVATKTIKPRAKKVEQLTKTTPAAPSDTTAQKTAHPPAPIKAGPTSQAALPPREPAIIKASPLYDQNPKPLYPPLAQKRGWQGVVLLAVMVLADGSPAQLRIQKSSGYELLDKTALATVQKWHFLPGTKNNIPSSMEVLVPVHFNLQ